MKFSGKNILVVGGSSGIGLALVSQLAGEGANVYVISRNPSNALTNSVKYIALDITGDVSEIASFLPEQLHGLVYSVGSINLKPFTRLTEEDFLNDYRINVLGAVKTIQQALKSLKNAKGAAITLISSVAAQTGLGFHASIAAAKAGLEGLAISLAAEFAPFQIRVNVVAPSLTDTPLAQNLLNTSEKREASAKRHPLNQIGKPEDIAKAIAFLLSDDSVWITGQTLGIDGGLGRLKTS
jgi:NAD(P)-dependent dehydrogenase (short-subunit alcohol dehydrogenase family)